MTGRATNAMLLHGAAPRGRDQSRCPRGAPGLARAAPPQLDGTAFLCVRLWCYLRTYLLRTVPLADIKGYIVERA